MMGGGVLAKCSEPSFSRADLISSFPIRYCRCEFHSLGQCASQAQDLPLLNPAASQPTFGPE